MTCGDDSEELLNMHVILTYYDSFKEIENKTLMLIYKI